MRWHEYDFDGLLQERRNSCALAIELRFLVLTMDFIWYHHGLSVQQIVQVNNKKYIQALYYWHLWEKPPMTGGFPYKVPVMQKKFPCRDVVMSFYVVFLGLFVCFYGLLLGLTVLWDAIAIFDQCLSIMLINDIMRPLTSIYSDTFINSYFMGPWSDSCMSN